MLCIPHYSYDLSKLNKCQIRCFNWKAIQSGAIIAYQSYQIKKLYIKTNTRG